MADKSWLPSPPKMRQNRFDLSDCSTPHSTSRACVRSSVFRLAMSSVSAGAKSENFLGKVPDWSTKI